MKHRTARYDDCVFRYVEAGPVQVEFCNGSHKWVRLVTSSGAHKNVFARLNRMNSTMIDNDIRGMANAARKLLAEYRKGF